MCTTCNLITVFTIRTMQQHRVNILYSNLLPSGYIQSMVGGLNGIRLHANSAPLLKFCWLPQMLWLRCFPNKNAGVPSKSATHFKPGLLWLGPLQHGIQHHLKCLAGCPKKCPKFKLQEDINPHTDSNIISDSLIQSLYGSAYWSLESKHFYIHDSLI